MGTRNLICVFTDGEYKVAQYGQWDGYPEGVGVEILQFLKNEFEPSKFKEGLNKCRFADWEGIDKKLLEEVKASPDWTKEYPHLSRDAGSDILGYVQNTNQEMVLKNNLAFASDSLMCEWAYCIDFDKGTFEVFEGFNKTPLDEGERFQNTPKEDDVAGYYPVKFIQEWPLNALPTKEEFLASFSQKED